MRFDARGTVRLRSALLVGSCAAVLVFLLFLATPFDLLEMAALDLRFRHRPDRPVNSSIVLIGIDDGSLRKLGQWPFPRSYHAQLIDILTEAGAKAVGFDIIFSEPSHDAGEDDLLVQSIAFNGRVHLPFYFARLKDGSPACAGSEPVLPIERMRAAAADVCAINAPSDPDGVTRSIPLVVRSGKTLHPTMGLSMALAALGVPREAVRLGRGRLEIPAKDGTRRVPLDAEGRLRVNFVGGYDSFFICPYETVLVSFFRERAGEKPTVPLSRFKDKIVLVGSLSSGIENLRPTPVSPLFPMFMVHANVLNSILENDFLVRPSPVVRLLILLFLGLAVAAVLVRATPLRGVLLSALLLAAYGAAAFLLFNRNVHLDLAAPAATVVLACLAGTVQNYILERREKDQVRGIFQRYVSPQIVRKLLAEKDAVKLGGSRSRVTVLFADIRGFTPLSESLPPEEVIALLNESLSMITEVVFAHDGTLDKFIGDCAMAVFGAPLVQEDQEIRAVKAAIEIRDRFAAVAERWAGRLGATVGIGIGIATGEAVIGNIGGAERMDYTPIGSTVNLAARLQALAAGGQIFVSGETFAAVAGMVSGSPCPPAQIKGISRPVVFHEISGLS